MAEITEFIRKAYKNHKVKQYLETHEIDPATIAKVLTAKVKTELVKEGEVK